jgi:hypothetical protein
MRSVFANEIEVPHKQRDSVFQVVQLFTESQSATGKAARERPHGKVCALDVARCRKSHIGVANATAAVQTNYLTRQKRRRTGKNLCLGCVIHFISKHGLN